MGQPALQRAPVKSLPSILDCDEVIVLLKKDPITNYKWWKRWLLLFTYWVTEYDGEIQLQSVCTTVARADELATHAGYRGIWMPVNEGLPEERVQWRPAIHFRSPYRSWYERYWPKLAAVPRGKLLRELADVDQKLERVAAITAAGRD